MIRAPEDTIPLGFEVGTGLPVSIPLRHICVTGQTQQSGKTTTLEALITRSGLRALAFVTKRGESSFHLMRPLKPYFRERTDWQFVQSLLEATMSERLKFQRAWIMRLCRAEHTKNETWPAPKTLADVQGNVETALKTARGMNQSVYTELDEYLRMVIPQIERLPYSTELALEPGVNVMDLTPYDFPLQALVVRSAIEWIHRQEHNTITVIPEAWKFTPKTRNTPVRLAAEELIREGGALKNWIWIDSQDLAGVADVLVRQIGVWICGVQRAKHEIERTLDNIPDDIRPRPRKADIMRLERGQFFVCWEGSMYKVYVQPAWMQSAHAQAIARGEENMDSVPDILTEFDQTHFYNLRTDPPVDANAGRAPKNEEAEEMLIKELAALLRLPGGSEYTENDIRNAIRNILNSLDALATEKRARVPELLGSSVMGLEKSSPSPGIPALPIDDWRELNPSTLERIWEYVRMRASSDPMVLQILKEKPELRVTVMRKTIEASTENLRGALGILISEKFFDQPTEQATIRAELIRRGFLGAKAPNLQILQAVQGLVELGFLTREPSGFQAVAGMKIHITEARG